jgi:hypothetical protein
MDNNLPLTVRGRAGYLIVPMLAIPLCAISAALYYQRTLTGFCVENAIKVIASAVVLDLLLFVGAIFLCSRRMTITGESLTHHTWFSHREVSISEISDVTRQTDHSIDSASVNYIVLWSSSGPVFKINPLLWDRTALQALLGRMLRLNPSIQVARDVYQLF